MVKVGLPLTLEESIEAMAHSRLHINVCSGLSHVAHSLKGLPLLLIQYRLNFSRWHPAQSEGWELCIGTAGAVEKITEKIGAP
jgi:ADP-heptose:LPS heptosyltransferase